MSSTSPSRILVDYTHEMDSRRPDNGEVIVVHLSQDLFGPGSTASDLSSQAPHHNYHHAVVIGRSYDESFITLTLFPMPAYSAIDPVSRLSSTSWLLSQPEDFQKLHIPVPHEITPVTHPHPLSPTPAQFGEPIEVDGWKDRRPRWIQVVPMLKVMEYTTIFKCYEPPVKLSPDDVRRLEEFGGLPIRPDSSGIMPPSPPGGGSAASEIPDTSSSGKETGPGSGSSQHPRQDGDYGGAAFGAGGSSALQALYAPDVVKQAFASLERQRNEKPDLILYDGDDDSDDDDDSNPDWEDRSDPITFLRYYVSHPLIAKIVQEHDDKMRERFNEGIASWLGGIQS